jgi:predicted Fe-S protein YdhL (DUF1289 family)
MIMRHLLIVIGLAGWGLGVAYGQTAAEALPSPPLPPMTQPPMQFFRNLLATNQAGRAAYLASRAPEQRQLLEQKLAEYQAMSPAQREARLAVTELRHYLLTVLNVDPRFRAQYVEQIPGRFRPLVMERLKLWDSLSPETQAAMLRNDKAFNFLVRMEKVAMPPMPPPVVPRINQYFRMSEAEKRQVLDSLPPEQRRAPEKILAALERLPKEQREKFTAALGKFISMSQSERDQFLKNAAQWQAMTLEQRRSVREMVNQVPPLPPLPPGFLSLNALTARGGQAPPVPPIPKPGF